MLHTLPNGCYTVACDHPRPAIGQNSQMGRASGRLRYLGLATLLVGLPLVTSAILGTAAATWAASPRRKAWWVAMGIALAAMTTSLGLSIGAVLSGAIHDTWFETDQTFDEGLNTGRRTVGYVAILAGIVLPGVVLLVGPKLRTRRRTV